MRATERRGRGRGQGGWLGEVTLRVRRGRGRRESRRPRCRGPRQCARQSSCALLLVFPTVGCGAATGGVWKRWGASWTRAPIAAPFHRLSCLPPPLSHHARAGRLGLSLPAFVLSKRDFHGGARGGCVVCAFCVGQEGEWVVFLLHSVFSRETPFPLSARHTRSTERAGRHTEGRGSLPHALRTSGGGSARAETHCTRFSLPPLSTPHTHTHAARAPRGCGV